MAQPLPVIVVRNKDIRKYFSNTEWYDMSGYEKEQTRNILRNHLVMIACGIKAPLPFFITNFEARQENLASIEEENKGSRSGPKKSIKSSKTHLLKTLPSEGEGPPKPRRGRPPKPTGPMSNSSKIGSMRGGEGPPKPRRGRPPKPKGPMSDSSKLGSMRGREPPPKPKRPMTRKAPKVQSKSVSTNVSKSALKSSSKLVVKTASKSVPKHSSKPRSERIANSSKIPRLQMEHCSGMRKQPPRLSKTVCGFIIKDSINSNRRKRSHVYKVAWSIL